MKIFFIFPCFRRILLYMKKMTSRLLIGLFCSTALWVTGCDWDDDDVSDHKPPAGQGSIVVDNNTDEDIKVYIDGTRVENAKDFDDRAYDLDPGLYRVVLDEDDGDRTYRDDIDVIEGRLTILDVSADPFDDDFDVEVFFRTP